MHPHAQFCSVVNCQSHPFFPNQYRSMQAPMPWQPSPLRCCPGHVHTFRSNPGCSTCSAVHAAPAFLAECRYTPMHDEYLRIPQYSTWQPQGRPGCPDDSSTSKSSPVHSSQQPSAALAAFQGPELLCPVWSIVVLERIYCAPLWTKVAQTSSRRIHKDQWLRLEHPCTKACEIEFQTKRSILERMAAEQ